MVMLSGNGSTDPDGNLPLSYAWVQTSGPLVMLSGANNVTATFTAPNTSTVLTFTLVVTDNLGLADQTPDEIMITVIARPEYKVYLPLVRKQ